MTQEDSSRTSKNAAIFDMLTGNRGKEMETYRIEFDDSKKNFYVRARDLAHVMDVLSEKSYTYKQISWVWTPNVDDLVVVRK